MTVIRPNSISGITSLTAYRGSIDFYAHDGSAATFTNINSNVTSGVSTFASLNITGDLDVGGALTYEDVTNVDSIGVVTARNGIDVTGGTVTITTGANSASPAGSGDNLVIKDSNGCGLSILSGNGNSQNIYLGSVSDNDAVRLEGFYNSGSPYFNIYTAGSERLRIDSSGRLQIGASNNTGTNTKLVVGAGNNINTTAIINTGDVDVNALTLSNWDGATTTNKVMIHFDSSGIGAFNIGMPAATDAFVIDDGGTERLRIKSDGDVYIGNIAHSNEGGANSSYRTLTLTDTTNGAQLHLRGQSPKLFLDVTSGGNGEIYYDSGDLRILSGEPGTTSSEKLRITSGGSVGVSTTTPVTILEVGDSGYDSNLTGSGGFQLTSKTNATGVAFNMVQQEGYRWIQYHGTGTSWIGPGNYGFVWNDGVTASTGLSVGLTTEGYMVGNRNVVQVIDATTATRFNGTGTNTLITSSTIKCNSNKSRFMIHVHCPVNSSDDSDAGNGNQNPYFAGYVQRNINGSGWTDCGGKGSTSQGGHSAHIELSPNRTGDSNTTDYWSGNRYRMEHKYAHFFDDELSLGDNSTIQFRLRVVNTGGGNWIQIGEPHGIGGDDNYPCQRWGMMIYELGPDTRFTVVNKVT